MISLSSSSMSMGHGGFSGGRSSMRASSLKNFGFGMNRISGVSRSSGSSGMIRSSGSSGMIRSSGSSGMIRSSGFSGMSTGFNISSSQAFITGNAMSSSALGANEKQTMQQLNDRLAKYLDSVRSLEKSNSELEMEIRQFHQQAAPSNRDFSDYWATIKSLQGQINDMILANAGIMLQVDNSKLAAEDFKTKFEYELGIRMSVENDINGLRVMLDNMTLDKSQLETQIENLHEELIYLRKNHEDELKELRNQISGTVSVNVRSENSIDLLKVLENTRNQYDELVKKNRNDAELWYKQQFESLQQEVSINTGALEGEKNQISQLRHTYQGLQTELQSLYSMISSLQGTLENTELRYSDERSKIEMTVSNLEMQLNDIRNNLKHQTEEYSRLLDIKCRLEMEIATYRRLLGGFGSQTSSSQSSVSQTSTIQKTSNISKAVIKEEEKKPVISTKKKSFTLVEKIVDGQVVSSHMEEMTIE